MNYIELVSLLSHYTAYQIVEGSRLREELDLTSFDMMLITNEIETKSGIELKTELFKNSMTVKDLYDVIKESSK